MVAIQHALQQIRDFSKHIRLRRRRWKYVVERKGVRLDGCMAHRALRWHMHLELRRKKRRVRIPPFGHGISTRRGSYSGIDTHITTQFLDLVVQVTP